MNLEALGQQILFHLHRRHRRREEPVGTDSNPSRLTPGGEGGEAVEFLADSMYLATGRCQRFGWINPLVEFEGGRPHLLDTLGWEAFKAIISILDLIVLFQAEIKY